MRPMFIFRQMEFYKKHRKEIICIEVLEDNQYVVRNTVRKVFVIVSLELYNFIYLLYLISRKYHFVYF